MRKLTLKQAKNLSLKKWELIVVQEGSDEGIEEHPNFKNLVNNCGLCQRYIPTENGVCGDCPLTSDRIGCCIEFFRWRDDPSKETAEAVLNLIRLIEEEE